MIVVVDYDMGNSGSVINMLRRVGHDAQLSGDPKVIANASKLILPGVGSFDKGMKNLSSRGLVEILNAKVLQENTPILGICLGIQLFTEYSEEGSVDGLGWIKGETRKFDTKKFDRDWRVPHMGWNTIEPTKQHYMTDDLEMDARYYFVHKFHVSCSDENDILTKSNYGYDFISSVAKKSIVGAQFHPEKSLRWGMSFLKRFVNGV